jgi:uncharacterized protein (DUF983 family)
LSQVGGSAGRRVGASSFWTKVGRALLLHCPRCGGGGILMSWFALRDRCPTCGLTFTRGEPSDYWLGAYAINLVLAEGLAAVIALAVLRVIWPAYMPAQITGMVLAVALPILMFPWSRTLWLAWDLSFRPREEGD